MYRFPRYQRVVLITTKRGKEIALLLRWMPTTCRKRGRTTRYAGRGHYCQLYQRLQQRTPASRSTPLPSPIRSAPAPTGRGNFSAGAQSYQLKRRPAAPPILSTRSPEAILPAGRNYPQFRFRSHNLRTNFEPKEMTGLKGTSISLSHINSRGVLTGSPEPRHRSPAPGAAASVWLFRPPFRYWTRACPGLHPFEDDQHCKSAQPGTDASETDNISKNSGDRQCLRHTAAGKGLNPGAASVSMPTR